MGKKEQRQQFISKRRKQEIERKKAENRANLFTATLLVLSFVTFGWQVMLFDKCFIPLNVPFLIFIVSGIAAALLLRKLLVKYIITEAKLSMLMLLIFASGSLFSGTFTITNYYFGSDKVVSVTLEITQTGRTHIRHSNGCSSHYVIVSYLGIVRKLHFKCDTYVDGYKYTDVSLKTGLWGYDVIVGKQLHN